MKYQYTIENLDCAHCASELEEAFKQVDGFSDVSLSFVNKKLTVCSKEDPTLKLEEIILKKEPEVKLHSMKNTVVELAIKGLDCAHCANEIEEALRKEGSLHNVYLNFMQKKLTYTTYEAKEVSMKKVQAVIHSLEDGVLLIDLQKQQADTFHQNGWYIVSAMVLFIVALFTKGVLSNGLYFIAYLLVGHKVLLKAFNNMFHGKLFDENFLMSIATIGAIVIHELPEAVGVMLFYQIGEYFQDLAVDRSRKSIASMMNMKQEYANVMENNQIVVKDIHEVGIHDRVLVKVGELIPLDGVVVDGNSFIDTSSLTGESKLQEVSKGSEVLSGSLNTSGRLTIEVMKDSKESTVSKILELVENASSKKAKSERFITVFAKYYTPVVCLIAAIIAFVLPLFIKEVPFSTFLYRGLSFLVVSCPCALVLSVPLAYFASIGGLSKKGILVKGGNYLEALAKVKTILLDKTGTITQGVFEVSEVVGHEDLLSICALIEASSTHPIAKSIVRSYEGSLDVTRVKDLQEIKGHGITCKVDGYFSAVGNYELIKQYVSDLVECQSVGSVVYVYHNQTYLGYIVVSDKVKDSSIKALKNMKVSGLKTVMLTGDSQHVAKAIATKVGVDQWYGKLLPNDKVSKMEEYLSQDQHVAFVGDGINDAPVLALADVGISMGQLGSDAAIEASDLVLMNDDLNDIYIAYHHAKKTQSIVKMNIVFAIVVKFIVLLLVSLGYSNMWMAIFADVGVSVLAILNSIRAMKI